MANAEPISSVPPSRSKQNAKFKDEYKVILLSVFAGLSAVVIDAVIDSFIFYDGPFLDQLIFAVPMAEVYFRSYILASFIIFGIVIQRILTKRRKAEEAFRDSEEKFRALTVSAKDAIILADDEGRISHWNPAAERVLGYTREEAIGKKMYQLVVPERFHEGFLKGFKNFTKTRQNYTARKPLEMLAVRKDGTELAVEISVSALQVEGKLHVVGIVRDITERKEAEKAIRESQKKFERLFMSNPEAAVFSDVNDYVLDTNPRFSELFGYSLDETKGKFIDDLIVPDDLKEEGKMLTAIREGYVYHDTVRKKKDGSLIPVSISSASIISEGQCLGNVVLYKDITERKKMEEALRESEEKYRTQFEEALDAIFVADAKTGIIIDCNRAASELVGREKSELVGKHQRILHPPKEIEGEFSRTFKQHLKEQEGQVLEAQVITKKGEIKDVAIKANVFELRDKKLIQGIFRDITERKKMERKLQEYTDHLEEMVAKRTRELRDSEEKYRHLFENANDAFVHLSLTGKVLNINRRAEEIAGRKKEDIIGKNFASLGLVGLRDVPKLLSLLKRKIEGKPTVGLETTITRNDGEKRFLEVNSTRIRESNVPQSVLAVIRDITERRKVEEQLVKTQKLAAIGELATMVGHDLRNPLQAIENATYYLNNELPFVFSSTPIPQKAKEMLQVINNSINYADKIIKDLQDFSTTKTPTLEKTDINTLIEETLSQVEAPENVKLTTELSHLPEIQVDKAQIKRVFLNLTTNAIQAMEKGGALTVSTKKTEGFIEVSFKDTGVGISKENMGKLFIPFFTMRAKGMGMGLPICKKFVDAHGGNIEVKSEVGKGTTFTVKLPIKRENGGENR